MVLLSTCREFSATGSAGAGGVGGVSTGLSSNIPSSNSHDVSIGVIALMGKYPQRWLPAFTVRCISFVGNSIGGTEFRDKSGNDADGNAVHIYNYIISFLTRNLRHKQVEKDFNSPGELEVSMTSLSEIVTSAILFPKNLICI